ncbi:hypothetical protein FRC05_009420 [Tulasnella sp. 425]|nr:hypothetical protein FRC05_009420 [Tulasnella sp. 425]
MSYTTKGKHNLNQGVAGVVSLGSLGNELFRVISVVRWKHSRDNVTQFFLLVALYKTYLDAENRANVGKRVAAGKYAPLKERVDNLKEKMKLIQREESEEDAKRFSELVLAEMEELITKEAQLQPDKDRHFKDHWDKAEMNKQKFLEKRSKERSDTGSISSRGGGRPVTLSIRINLGDTRSDLTFPHYFRDSYMSALVPYALAHPQLDAPQQTRGKGGKEVRPQPPIKRQAMDALYVRLVDENKRARWNLIDRGRKMTVAEFERLTTQDPTVEVRFISCRIRFVLLATYNGNRNFERILDLDRDKKELLQLLESQALRDNGSIHSTGTRRTRGRGLGHGDNFGAGQDLIKKIQPQTFLLIQGEDQFAPPPAEPKDTGCQCIIC